MNPNTGAVVAGKLQETTRDPGIRMMVLLSELQQARV
jgi:hypothetical protein